MYQEKNKINNKLATVLMTFFVVILILTMILIENKDEQIKYLEQKQNAENIITGYVTRASYDSFSVPQKVSRQQNKIYITDTATYKTGYYSINGSAWRSFQLAGNNYPNNNEWLSGIVTHTLPEELQNPGEHYIIIYSCTRSNNKWDCHGNEQNPKGFWQLIIIDDNSEKNMECGRCDIGHECEQGICVRTGTGKTYYVALNGNNSNPGTIDEPWATLQHAIYLAKPGDIVYIRGGTHYPEQAIILNPSEKKGVSGTAEEPIRYLNYPGEHAIFDFKNKDIYASYYNNGLAMHATEHIHLRGMTVRNLHQRPYDTVNKRHAEASGISCTSCANILYENLIVHDVDGRGFQHWGGAWSDKDAQHSVDSGYRTNYMAPVFESDHTAWINCDAYNLYDRHASSPGNAADGWKVGGYYGNSYLWEGCRAFNYSDDGFDPHGTGYRTFKNCWAMSTDKYQGLSDAWNIEGNGFKMTGVNPLLVENYQLGGESFVRVENCIAAFNMGSGFVNNILVNYAVTEFGGQWPNNGIFYNNLAYKNNIGQGDKNGSIHRNNIVYDSQTKDPRGAKYELVLYQTAINESHNTWIGHPRAGDWWWKYNPEFNVTDDDFESLDYWELTMPRKSDFSLPDINFGKLKNTSELINAGIDVGLPYAGSAPDIGPFEHGLIREETCLGPSTRYCAMENAYGEQKRTCYNRGNWSEFGICEFITCKQGYTLNENECVISPGWTKELVYNGGFEGSINGWTTSNNGWTTKEYTYSHPTTLAQEGHYWAGSDSSSINGHIYQDINLNEYMGYVDQGLVVANISGWGRTPSRYGTHARSRIQFMLLNSEKEIISNILDTNYVNNNTWWEAKLTEYPIPENTRYIRVWGNTYETYSNSNSASGDLDSFSVKIKILE